MATAERGQPAGDAPAEGASEGVAERQLRGSTILVIDDHAFIRRMIEQCLANAGFARMEFAVDGQEGLEKVAAVSPDLIVLDINMPRLGGIEFLRRLRADPVHRRIPVLVQTAATEEAARNEAFDAGATDYVTKPINFKELSSRVRIHLENRLLIRELRSYRDRVDSELQMAREMQTAILPEPERVEELQRRYGVRLDGHFEPSSELGGDYWGAVALDESRIGLLSVDFSGHGIGAALNTVRLHAIMSQLPPPATDPAAYLTALNAQLHRQLPRGQFATMVYGIVDLREGALTFASAAAPAPMVGRAGGGPAEVLAEPAGLPLGVMATGTYENRRVPFGPGSFVFLYSDALFESPLVAGGRLGQGGVPALVERSRAAARPLQEVIAAFDAMAQKPIPDDLTAIWLQRG